MNGEPVPVHLMVGVNTYITWVLNQVRPINGKMVRRSEWQWERERERQRSGERFFYTVSDFRKKRRKEVRK